MRKIRQGMFETNSSSTHSITIHPGVCTAKLAVNVNGAVTIRPGDFGWEVETYKDAETKASYCLTYAMQTKRGKLLKMLRKVIKEQVGAKSVAFEALHPDSDYGDEWGHIDHQSIDDSDVCGPAFESETALRQFIFNRESILRTDNDNHE